VVLATVAIVPLSLTACTPGAEAGLPAEDRRQATVIGSEQDVFTVIFEFEIQPDQQEEISAAIQQLLSEVVSTQPGFISAHLHLSTDGGKVLNYFQWESQDAFNTFRANEEAMSQIQPVIAPYGPMPRVCEIVYSAVR
jgi:heme-degrading monooxygenase HmoA